MLSLHGVKLLYGKRARRFVVKSNVLEHFDGLRILAPVEQELW
jgi:hypothetical protein